MNMPIFDRLKALWLPLILLACLSCQQDLYEVYEINPVDVLPVNAEKDKSKTDAQYISILYTNLFQEPIGPNRMLEAQAAIASVGDKQIAYDMLVSKYMRDAPALPSRQELDDDPRQFIIDTYQRFFTRLPTQAELEWMDSFLTRNPSLTPEQIYFSFATSYEYYHY